MATTLFMYSHGSNFGPGGGASSGWKMDTVRDVGSLSATMNTTASGNHILITSNPKTWWFQVNAVTISGSISFNWWGLEDAMTTNARLACRIARTDSSGTEISDVVANANANHPDGVELGTASALMTWSATPTSTSFNAGDWIKVEPHADAIGTMAAGTVTLNLGGTTGGVSGDTFITFTETITVFSGTPASLLVPHRHRGLIVR